MFLLGSIFKLTSFIRDQAAQLRKQYEDLCREFEEDGSTQQPSKNVAETKRERLSADARPAQGLPQANSISRRDVKRTARYTDDPNAQSEARAALMPYSDDLDDVPDHTHLDNQRIHQYHSQILHEQDDQLDRLGESIHRQRDLSIHIGDELDEQAEIIDDLDRGVMRHQSQLDKAKGRLSDFSRKAKDNWSIVTIAVLIVILLLLIILLKS